MNAEVLHITTPAAWAAAQVSGALRPPSLATEGFVHCSTRAQLAATLDRHYRGAGPLVVLVLDADVLADDLRWEESHPGEHFPHIYAPVPTTAVLAVEAISAPSG